MIGIICQESETDKLNCLLYYFVIIVDCNDGQIRLTGGTSSMEGTVEVCYYSTWGLIADADWGNQDAQVACKQLGYREGN